MNFIRVHAWIQPTCHFSPFFSGSTRTVADAALFLEVTAGPDDRDRLSLEKPAPHYRDELNAGISGLRIAWSPDLGYVDNLDPEVASITAKAAAVYESLGAHVEELQKAAAK